MIKKLVSAAQNGDKETIETLLTEGVDINSKNRSGYTALSWAAHNGHTGVVKLLLEQGANPNLPDNQGNTALHWATRNDHEDVIKFLLQYGTNKELKNNNGLTPLEFAFAYNKQRTHKLEESMQKMMDEIAQLKQRIQQLEINKNASLTNEKTNQEIDTSKQYSFFKSTN